MPRIVADERGKDLSGADFRGISVPSVLGQAARYDARILTAIEKNTLRLRWLAGAPADQPCARR